MKKKYVVELTNAERGRLLKLLSAGTAHRELFEDEHGVEVWASSVVSRAFSRLLGLALKKSPSRPKKSATKKSAQEAGVRRR